MNILFICGAVGIGSDGVGDYTRRLCGRLIKIGHKTEIVALCDHNLSYVVENQFIEDVSITVHRIPISTNNKERLILLQEILNTFRPEWISLQFVLYSFNPKGLPFWLPSFFEKLEGNHKWQIMFHELWIGMDVKASYKHKIIGFLQQKIIIKLLKKIKAKVINTQTDLYQNKLSGLGYISQILPLYSNIIKNKESNIKRINDELELKFCIFGSIHHGAPVLKFIKDLKQILLSTNDTVLKFVFIGHCGVAIEEWKNVLLANKIQFEITGFVNDKEISTLLSSCKYGISTTPYILSQKSGSLAAMFEHDLPVLCVARNWNVKKFYQKKEMNLINYEDKETIKEFMKRTFIESNENNLEFVALNFLNGLK